ncbi:MAG: hypothetical protein ABL890_03545 [Candidatus Peribacteraceae bacterium]
MSKRDRILEAFHAIDPRPCGLQHERIVKLGAPGETNTLTSQCKARDQVLRLSCAHNSAAKKVLQRTVSYLVRQAVLTAEAGRELNAFISRGKAEINLLDLDLAELVDTATVMKGNGCAGGNHEQRDRQLRSQHTAIARALRDVYHYVGGALDYWKKLVDEDVWEGAYDTLHPLPESVSLDLTPAK